MPTRPSIKGTSGLYTSLGLINAVLNDENNDLLSGVPNAVDTTDSIRMVGQEITAFVPRANQFVTSLINKIGMTKLQYMLFTNPWQWAKQGKLEMGETVEEIWIGLAKAFPYNPKQSETRFLKRQEPDVKSAFHSINYKTVYKITVSFQALKQAFLSKDGLVNFIDNLIGSLARSANGDEFMAMKYLLAVLLLNGNIKTVTIPEITNASANDVVTEVSATTNLFQFPSTDYTMAGNENTTPITDLMVLESAKANAQIKVNSLASAFNVEYVKFMGNVTMYDSLASYNWDRMDDIFADDKGYRRFTTEELNLLKTVDIICMDRKFMQIYDGFEGMGEPLRNGEGLFENYFYHSQKILSASPFMNCVAYTTVTSTVTVVTVTPDTATVSKGAQVSLQAMVATTGFADSSVVWEISTQGVAEGTRIGQDGVLRVASNETKASIIVTATSVFDETKKGTATITVKA